MTLCVQSNQYLVRIKFHISLNELWTKQREIELAYSQQRSHEWGII